LSIDNFKYKGKEVKTMSKKLLQEVMNNKKARNRKELKKLAIKNSAHVLAWWSF
jgi:hypothetical protein